jgi:hypothetical protein
MNTTNTEELVEGAVANEEALVPGEALEEGFDYDKEFAAQAAKINAKKQGVDVIDRQSGVDAGNVVDPEIVDPDAELIAYLPEDKRDAARARFKAAEDERMRADKLALDLRSVSGRVSAYQRLYEEARGIKAPTPEPEKVQAKDEKEWTQFTEDYPDIAKAIESKFKDARPATPDPTVRELAEFVHNEKRDRFLHEAFDTVEAIHAGWRERCSTEEFKQWKSSSSTYEKLAASDDIADAIALLDLYEAHTAKSTPEFDPQAAANAARLAARRGAQAEGGKGAGKTKGASPNENVDLKDEDQLFAFYAQNANKRIKARYS